MKTYSQLTAQYVSDTNNNETANQTFGQTKINDSIFTICNLQGGKLRFLESTKDMVTVASQEAYQIPNGFRKLIDLYIYSGSGTSSDTIYSPEMVFDPTKWKRILQYRLGTGDVPYFTYVENQVYRIQPVPSTSGNKITLRGRLQIRNLTIPDVTNLTVASIANGDTVLTMSGGMTADMVGRYIQITETSAVGGGDGFWYQIGSYTSATIVGLAKPYEGTTISGGTATSIIGQCSVIPEAYQPAILFRSEALYWEQQKDIERAKVCWLKYDGGVEAGYAKEYGGLIGEMLANEGETEEGAYIPPYGSQSNTILTAPYYFPYQLASGFN